MDHYFTQTLTQSAEVTAAILERTISPQAIDHTFAKKYLEEVAEKNFILYLRLLSKILSTTTHSPVSRMAAGLQLKNQLKSHDPSTQNIWHMRWNKLSIFTREYIKCNLLETMGTETMHPSSAAQCIATIAAAEMPLNRWMKLPEILFRKVNEVEDDDYSECAMETIGYMCQDIRCAALTNQSGVILKAIIKCMNVSLPGKHVSLTTMTAFLNTLEFVKENFDTPDECGLVIKIVYQTLTTPDLQICLVAMQCMVKICHLYYEHMDPWMNGIIAPVAMDALTCGQDEMVMMAFELWCTICEKEMEIEAQNETNSSSIQRSSQPVLRFYGRRFVDSMVPIFMHHITTNFHSLDDSWSVPKAARRCLMSFAGVCKMELVSRLLPVISVNVDSVLWFRRQISLLLFGCLLDGVNIKTGGDLVESFMPTLIKLMTDDNFLVRDCALWTASRICDIMPEVVAKEIFINSFIAALLFALSSEPAVAAKVCWALISVTNAIHEEIIVKNNSTPETTCLSPYYTLLVKALIETTIRGDSKQANLRAASYEALVGMVKSAPADCYSSVMTVVNELVERLTRFVNDMKRFNSHNDRMQMNDVQTLLCTSLQSALRRVQLAEATKMCEPLMDTLLKMFNATMDRTDGIQEDIFMVMSSLIYAMGTQFAKYVDKVIVFIAFGLDRQEDTKVFCATLLLISEICSSLNHQVMPHHDDILTVCIAHLVKTTLNENTKMKILRTIGDLAMGIGIAFETYVKHICTVLYELASQEVAENGTIIVAEKYRELRNGSLEVYTSIVRALNVVGETNTTDPSVIDPYYPQMINLISRVLDDRGAPDEMIGSAAGLLGDLCTTYGTKIQSLLQASLLTQQLATISQTELSERTERLTNWALVEAQKLLSV